MVDVVGELAREGMSSELLYADDLVIKSEIITLIRSRFRKRKGAFVSMGLKVNVGPEVRLAIKLKKE